MNKKILVITPRFPIPAAGACEQDRLEGIKQLKRLRNEVRVIGKVFDFQDKNKIIDFSVGQNIPVYLIPYRYDKKLGFMGKFFYYLKRFSRLAYWDGSVYEYADPEIKKKMTEVLKSWRPDIVWFDYTFMLPLYKLARRHNCRIITHSLIYEPNNLLEEEGRGPMNFARAKLKTLTEYKSVKKSDYIFAITPDETDLYKKLGAQNIRTLPLRALYNFIGKNSHVRDRERLNVFFMGSTYNVKHNLRAAKFFIEEIFPLANKAWPDKFEFFIVGRKLPESLQAKCAKSENINYLGFVDDLDKFLSDMDIALIPSLSGAGMQQKIFEPIVRGFPTVVSARGLAGYSFTCGQEILCATKAEEFVAALGRLLDLAARKKLSEKAIEKSWELFSREKSDGLIQQAL